MDVVLSSGILKAKQKLGVTINSDKLGVIDFTKFSKVTMCSAQEEPQAIDFENFVKSMTFCLPKLKVTPSFCFAFKIPDDMTVTNKYFITIMPSKIDNSEC